MLENIWHFILPTDRFTVNLPAFRRCASEAQACVDDKPPLPGFEEKPFLVLNSRHCQLDFKRLHGIGVLTSGKYPAKTFQSTHDPFLCCQSACSVCSTTLCRQISA